jgi:hypothetical protein
LRFAGALASSGEANEVKQAMGGLRFYQFLWSFYNARQSLLLNPHARLFRVGAWAIHGVSNA